MRRFLRMLHSIGQIVEKRERVELGRGAGGSFRAAKTGASVDSGPGTAEFQQAIEGSV